MDYSAIVQTLQRSLILLEKSNPRTRSLQVLYCWCRLKIHHRHCKIHWYSAL